MYRIIITINVKKRGEVVVSYLASHACMDHGYLAMFSTFKTFVC